MQKRDFILASVAASLTAIHETKAIASPAQTNNEALKQIDTKAKTIAFVLYPNMTPQDIVGPAMTLPNTGYNIEYIWHDKKTLPTEIPMITFAPTKTFDELDKVDILCITGTRNPFNVLKDEKLLRWVNHVGSNAEYVTSVCTGAIILAAAGLLKGYRASTHWTYKDTLAALEGIPSQERVTIDRNRITGGGVTAALDFSLSLLAALKSEETAKLTQLMLQYDPHPPFKAGNPCDAGSDLVKQAIKFTNNILDAETPNHEEILAKAIKRLKTFP